MAIGQSDGSIILSTKVDTSGINKGMNSIKGTIGKIGAAIGVAFGVSALVNFKKESVNLYKIQMQNEVKLATVMRERVNATNEQIQSVLDLTAAEQRLGIIGDEVQIAGLQQLATFAKQTETIETLLPAMNNLIAQQYGFEAATGSAVNVANLMGKVLQGQTGALTRVGITFTEAQEKILKYGTESEKAATLAQVITDNVGEMNKALAKTDVGRQQQLANTLGDIKEQFGEAINQISIVFLPLLQTVAKLLSNIAIIFREIASGIANTFGVENNQKQWEKISEDTDKTAENIQEQAKNQEELNKEMKKTLAGFDDIQILSRQTAETTEMSGDVFLPSTIVSDTTSGTGGEIDTSKYQEIASAIKSTLADILEAASKALLAVGLIVLFSGNILGGIGLIMAGAAAYVSGDALGSENPLETLKGHLETLEEYIVPALLGLGVLLLFLGMIPLGIGLILGGIAYWGYEQVQAEEYDTADFQTKLNVVMEAVSLGLVAIGVMLIFFGHVPLGIGFIFAGKELLNATEEKIEEGGITTKLQKFIEENQNLIVGVSLAILVVALILMSMGNINAFTLGLLATGAEGLTISADMTNKSVKEIIQNFFKENSSLIVGVSIALLVIGIILCVSGVINGLSIGLIATGAVALGSEIAINWDTMISNIRNFLFENPELVSLISGGLLILGIILCATGVALPLGVGLIAVGATGLVAEATLNWNFIIDKLNELMDEWGAWIAGAGTLLLVLGIILCATGVGIPFGVALIIAGAAGLVTPITMGWDAIVDWVKGAWDAVVAFWDEYIAPVFTAKFWKDLAKTCGNGLIAGFEGAINGIIWLFESLINLVVSGLNLFIGGLSTVTGAIGDLIGIDLRIPEIPKADLGRVSIPRLAQGTVVPPNREFLAVLGDNKKEHEIVSPVSTMKQAFAETMLEIGATGQTTKEEHYYLGETELMTILYKLVKGGERLQGSSLITNGGSY